MASNPDTERNKRVSGLMCRDGRFPPGADGERASYIYSIRKTASAIRSGDPCTKGDLALLQVQYKSLEDLHRKFTQAHADLMPLLADQKFAAQEHELFDTINREVTGALAVTKRAIKTREYIERPMPTLVKASVTTTIAEPKTELERLIAQNAVLMHRLAMAKKEEPQPMPSNSQSVQPSTSKELAKRICSPTTKPKAIQGGRIDKRVHLKEVISKKQVKSAIVNATTMYSKRETTCAYCFGSHKIFRCDQFKQLKLHGRLEAVKRMRLCLICLLPKIHNHKCAKSHAECKLCAPELHNSLLCPRRCISD